MRDPLILSITLQILLLVLTGCAGNKAIAELQYGGAPNAANIGRDELDEASEMRWAAVPAVFVNDTYFRIYADELHHHVPDLDNTWVYLGNVQSAVPGWESPTQNFQTNNEALIGAEIYYSSGGRIPVMNSVWNDPLEEEIIGDIITISFEGSRLWYISEEAHTDAFEVMDAVVRHSLMVDEVMYSLMATAGGGDFSLSDNHIFLGEVKSAVAIDKYPTENLQANRDNVVGAKVYRLPSHERNDIVVFYNADSRYYYEHLPGADENWVIAKADDIAPKTLDEAMDLYMQSIEANIYLLGDWFAYSYRILDTMELHENKFIIYAHTLSEWIDMDGESVSGGAGLVAVTFNKYKDNFEYEKHEFLYYPKVSDVPDVPQKVKDSYTNDSYFEEMRSEVSQAIAEFLALNQ